MPWQYRRMSTDTAKELMPTQVVLVPGFWLGAWAWDEVAEELSDRGYEVTALTLPGLEAEDQARAVTLEDQTRAIIDALDPAAERRVLVVHSGAALPGTMVIDQHPHLVDRIIFVDTAPVRDGYAMNPDLEGDTYPLEAAWDEEFEGGSMRDLTDEQLETFKARAVPQPAGTVRGAVRLQDRRRLQVPATVICTAFPATDYRAYAEQGMGFLAGLLDHEDLSYVDLPTGHWPMWSKPEALTAVIAQAANV